MTVDSLLQGFYAIICKGFAPITHVRNKNSNIPGRSVTQCGKSYLSYQYIVLLKERICSLREQILSFKSNSHFEKGAIEENHCLIQ